MMNFRTILVIITIITSFVSCKKNEIILDNDASTPSLNKGYIQFDTDIKTKGGIIMGTSLKDNFAVLGYQFRGTWESHQVLAEPNVFYDNENKILLPCEIIYDTTDGLYKYEPLQEWTGNNYYFFGYYPADNNSITLFDNGTLRHGEPYITYVLPDTNNPNATIDVMTAAVSTNANTSTSVGMHMYHRLSAIDVSIRNKTIIDTDGNSSTDADKQKLTIEISDLKVVLGNADNPEGQLVTSAIIPLNPETTISPISEAKGDRTFYLVGNYDWTSNIVTVAPETTKIIDNENRTPDKEDDDTPLSVLLIPQNSYLQGTITITYKQTYEEGGNTTTVYAGTREFNFTFNKVLEERRRYSIDLTFTSDAMSISVEPFTDWDSKNVNHDFM